MTTVLWRQRPVFYMPCPSYLMGLFNRHCHNIWCHKWEKKSTGLISDKKKKKKKLKTFLKWWISFSYFTHCFCIYKLRSKTVRYSIESLNFLLPPGWILICMHSYKSNRGHANYPWNTKCGASIFIICEYILQQLCILIYYSP